MLNRNDKCHKSSWRIEITEQGSIFLDKWYERVFIGTFPRDVLKDKELLLIELCDRLDKKNKSHLDEYVKDMLKGDNYGELR